MSKPPFPFDLAALGRELSPESLCGEAEPLAHAQQRYLAACHEAAHLLAALSCNSCIRQVIVRPRQSLADYHGSGGACRTLESSPDREVFCALVGAAFEEQATREGGSAAAAEHDIRLAKEAMPDQWHQLAPYSAQFVHDVRASGLLREAAAGILNMSDRKGCLAGGKLDRLLRHLRPRVQRYEAMVPRSLRQELERAGMRSTPTSATPSDYGELLKLLGAAD